MYIEATFLATELSKRVYVSQKGCEISVTFADKGHTKVASFPSKAESYEVQFSKKLAAVQIFIQLD